MRTFFSSFFRKMVAQQLRRCSCLNVHVELVLFGIGRSSHLAPAIALVLLLLLVGVFVLRWMVRAIHLILMVVMMEVAAVAL